MTVTPAARAAVGPLLPHPDEGVRAFAFYYVAHAIGELGEPSRTEWLPEIRRLLDDPEGDIQETAQELLDELSPRPAPATARPPEERRKSGLVARVPGAHTCRADLPVPARLKTRRWENALITVPCRYRRVSLALFQSCAADPRAASGARDAALIAVLAGAALRRAEASALDLADVDLSEGSLVVRGKGGRERRTFLAQGGEEAVGAWIDVRGTEPGPLFVGVAKGGAIDPAMGRVGPDAILAILRRRARRAGVADFSAHDLRRTFIGEALEAGADLAAVQQLGRASKRHHHRPLRPPAGGGAAAGGAARADSLRRAELIATTYERRIHPTRPTLVWGIPAKAMARHNPWLDEDARSASGWMGPRLLRPFMLEFAALTNRPGALHDRRRRDGLRSKTDP
jgi:integrase